MFVRSDSEGKMQMLLSPQKIGSYRQTDPEEQTMLRVVGSKAKWMSTADYCLHKTAAWEHLSMELE